MARLVARQDLALFVAERVADLIESVAADCEAAGEPLTEEQRSVLRAAGRHLLRELR